MLYVEKIENHRIGNNTPFSKVAKSLGWTLTIDESETERAYDGSLWEKGYAPVKPNPTVEEQNEAIRATREQLYQQTSDKLKADYDEAVARGSDNAEELKQAWLSSKDKIRAENPYVVDENKPEETEKVVLSVDNEPELSDNISED